MSDTKTTIVPSNLKVTELKQALSERDLSTKGLKKELISRLEEALATESSNEIDGKIDDTNVTIEQDDILLPLEPISDTNNQIIQEESTIDEAEKTGLEKISETSVETPSEISSKEPITQENGLTENAALLTENSEPKDVVQENIVPECATNIQEALALDNQTISDLTPHSHEELSSLPTESTPKEDMLSENPIVQSIPESKSEAVDLINGNSFEQPQSALEIPVNNSISSIQITQTVIESSTTLIPNSPKLELISDENETISSTSLNNQTHSEPQTAVVDSGVKAEITTSLSNNGEKNGSAIEDDAVSFQPSPNLDIAIKQSPENVTEICSEFQTPQTNCSGEPLKFIAITNLTRPFPLGDFEEQLREYGPITQFWIDKFRSHCYVQYENGEGASLCKSMLSGVQFPPDTGKKLDVALLDDSEGLTLLQRERSSKQRFTLALEGDKPELQEYLDGKKLVRGLPSARRSLPQDSVQNEDRKRLHTNLPPQIPLDRLFLKTTTKPCLYYKPNKSPSNIEMSKKGLPSANSFETSKPVRNGSVHSASTGN